MQIIETPAGSAVGIAREMTRWEKLRSDIRRHWWWYVWRRVPYLVWHGQEVDVTVYFTELPLGSDGGLYTLWEVEDRLDKLGLSFDTGGGGEGRDWEWDYSLRGPVRIRFRGRAKNPHLRVRKQEPTKPKLA